MFEIPSYTLSSSLKKVIEHPQEYLADVCFRFHNADIWVHEGILLSRCPSTFIQQFLSYLPHKSDHDSDNGCIIKIDHPLLSSSLFMALVQYWYTANLVFHSLPNHLVKQLDSLENELGVRLLPRSDSSNGDNAAATLQHEAYTQLAEDIKRMRHEQLGCDINISLPTDDDTATISIPAHRFILASQSTYFYAMFCTDFCESQTRVVHLTDHFFTPMVMQVILHYLYSDSITIPPPPQLDFVYNNITASRLPPSLTKLQKLTMKKHSLRVLQKTYVAADYLGQMKTLGAAVLHAMDQTCDGFKCLCHDCVRLLPSMLSFADNKKDDPRLSRLRAALVTFYSDPVHAIEHLWSQKPFALLVHSMIPSAASMVKPLDKSPMDNWHKPSSSLILEISESAYANITKHNAIHVLHSLHICFSKLRSADLLPTWSLPILDLLDPILHSTVTMVSQNFDFYCVEYPILVSCVDGIGCGFSIDFLDFLLKRVLDQGIQDANAGTIYQGIVRDLIGRQETVKNVALDNVLPHARAQCAAYLARRWLSVKSSGGFRSLEKATMRQLSVDIGIHYRTLTKPFDSDLLSLFSFKPKSTKYALKLKSENDSPYLTPPTTHPGSGISFPRRRSFGTQRGSNTADITTNRPALATTRPRSHSAGSEPYTPKYHPIKADISSDYMNNNTINALSTQPLIHLLSMETESRRYKQEMGNMTGSDALESKELLTEEDLLDALLPLEKIVPIVNDNNKTNRKSQDGIGGERSTKLKFAIPSGGPTHAKSPLHPSLYGQLLSSPSNPSAAELLSSPRPSLISKKKNRRMKRHGLSSKRSKWGLGASSGSDDSEEEDEATTLTTMITPMIGAKVKLRHRPLPTFGSIKYVGPVSFAKGTWIGLELESRLGKNNGCVSGVTYFRTDPQRGLFVKQDDFTIISIPSITT